MCVLQWAWWTATWCTLWEWAGCTWGRTCVSPPTECLHPSAKGCCCECSVSFRPASTSTARELWNQGFCRSAPRWFRAALGPFVSAPRAFVKHSLAHTRARMQKKTCSTNAKQMNKRATHLEFGLSKSLFDVVLDLEYFGQVSLINFNILKKLFGSTNLNLHN